MGKAHEIGFNNWNHPDYSVLPKKVADKIQYAYFLDNSEREYNRIFKALSDGCIDDVFPGINSKDIAMRSSDSSMLTLLKQPIRMIVKKTGLRRRSPPKRKEPAWSIRANVKKSGTRPGVIFKRGKNIDRKRSGLRKQSTKPKRINPTSSFATRVNSFVFRWNPSATWRQFPNPYCAECISDRLRALPGIR